MLGPVTVHARTIGMLFYHSCQWPTSACETVSQAFSLSRLRRRGQHRRVHLHAKHKMPKTCAWTLLMHACSADMTQLNPTRLNMRATSPPSKVRPWTGSWQRWATATRHPRSRHTTSSVSATSPEGARRPSGQARLAQRAPARPLCCCRAGTMCSCQVTDGDLAGQRPQGHNDSNINNSSVCCYGVSVNT